MSLSELLKSQTLRKPLLLVLATQMAQQFSGTNVGFHFSTTIFKKNFEHQVAVALTAGLTATNVVVLLTCMCLIDRIGRRPLLLTSSLGMAFSSLALTCAAHFKLDPVIQAIFFMCFTGSYGAGLGMIPWLLPPELIPRYAIDSANSFSACFNWSSSLLVAFFIPILLTLGKFHDIHC
jgi:MFS family permease